MDIPFYADYYYCNKRACEFLEDFNINSFPVNPIDIIHEIGLDLETYSNVARQNDITVDEVCAKLHTKDAITFYDGHDCIIYYNDTLIEGRVRFTLMHEIGHVYLGHLAKYEKTVVIPKNEFSSLSFKEYKVLENEANAFARNVLAPVSMIKHLKDQSLDNICSIFGISYLAAATRLSFLELDYANYAKLGFSDRILKIFSNFFYKKVCPICGYGSIQKSSICIICGHKMEWGNGDNMKYPMLAVNTENKLLKCPICGNEETAIEGHFCQICGTRLINACSNSNCNIILPSNARYCPICGSHSVFFNSNILQAWNKVDAFMTIPDDIDEELPFN